MSADTFARAMKIADAVLYEGYILYPYRSSAAKNHVRFQFGVLAPRVWCDAGGSEHAWMRTECLVEPTGERPRVEGKVRALQLQQRQVERHGNPVASTEIEGRLYQSWDEGVEREVGFAIDLAPSEKVIPFELEGGSAIEELGDGARLVRRRWPVRGEIRVVVEAAGALRKLTVRVENLSACEPRASRDEALRASLLGAHTLLAALDAAFVSLIDPPEGAAACKNERTFPVLAGAAGDRSLVLSSPIILYDHPAIAPESPADLYDGCEIDEILTLRTMTLTDAEKREVRATDPRAAALLDRIDAMAPETLERLHGTIREMRVLDGPPPETDSVDVAGVTVAKGSRVRLKPRRSADAQDMFLVGRIGLVHAVFRDVEERRYVAVSIEDDPAADLMLVHGRFHYFYPDELEPV